MEIHLDYETFSAADIRKVGGWRYALDPSTELLCAAVSFDGQEPLTYIPSGGGELALSQLITGIQRAKVVWAHNAEFELAITLGVLGLPVDPRKFRCSAVLCRIAGLPHHLGDISKTLPDFAAPKSDGQKLINRFCKPRRPSKNNPARRVYPGDDPVGFGELVEYCKQDVRAELEVHYRLHTFQTERHWRDFHNTVALNMRGIPVDVPTIQHAKGVCERRAAILKGELSKITGGVNASQRDKFLTWCFTEGFSAGDLKAETVTKELLGWNIGPKLKMALQYRQLLSATSTKKLPKLLAMEWNGRIHGGFMYYGAIQTGRWAGKLVQPQNFKRGEPSTRQFFESLKQGYSLEALLTTYGDPLKLVGETIRRFIAHGEGVTRCDFSQIEARIVNWSAGQTDKLEEFRQGLDVYKILASRIYNKPVADITKDERWLGKQGELGCGFQAGGGAIVRQCAKYGVVIPEQMGELIKDAYRKSHPKVVRYWYACKDAFVNALMNPGQPYKAGNVVYTCTAEHNGRPSYMAATLPSGRNIIYPWPKRLPGGDICYYGLTDKHKWVEDIHLYGGKLAENNTQAIAADLMAEALNNALDARLSVFGIVHDDMLAYGCFEESLRDCFLTMPDWAAGLPIAVETSSLPYYE